MQSKFRRHWIEQEEVQIIEGITRFERSEWQSYLNNSSRGHVVQNPTFGVDPRLARARACVGLVK